MRPQIFVTLILLCLAPLAQAGDVSQLDASSKEALQKTMGLLRNKSQREQAAAHDAKATSAYSSAKSVVGGDARNEQDMFEQAAEIFQTLVLEANGDPKKIEALVAELQKNPASLESKLTAAQKLKLSNLAEKITHPPVANRKD